MFVKAAAKELVLPSIGKLRASDCASASAWMQPTQAWLHPT